ncbi:MAG: NAD(P)H-dependent oxidoreductase [Halobacteriota archaeon]|nr:NAD(P)H-dependent oxidoreductase [Halobacteriota archaeon]
MKMLAICGSPHRGNCYSVLNKIKEDNPDIDFKLIMLGEVDLKQCKGCYLCVLRGEEFCPLKDDRDTIIQEISDADGIILASPVNVNHVSSLMKQFIDRLGYLGHRPRFYDKYVMVMAIGAGFGADKANEYMSGIFSVFGFNVVSSLELYIASKAERDSTYNHEKTADAFNTFITSIKEGQGKKPSPNLTQLIYFNIFKAVSELNKEEGKSDYEFYKDKDEYYYDTKISFFKKMIAKRISGKKIAKMSKNR